MKPKRLLATAITIAAIGMGNTALSSELSKSAPVQPAAFIFTAEPTALLKLSEVDRNLAFVLHRVIQTQPGGGQLDLGGGAITVAVPHDEEELRSLLRGLAANPKGATSLMQYEYRRLGGADDATMRFIFAPRPAGSAEPVIVEFVRTPLNTERYRLARWRWR